MKRRSIVIGMLAASVHAGSAVEASSRAIQVPLDSGCTLSIDVVSDDKPACWRLACPGGSMRELACDVTAMHRVNSVMLGESGTTLAVVSVGEGHPILELVPLVPLVDAGVYAAACTIDPFPGTLGDVTSGQSGWLVESTVDLLADGLAARAGSVGQAPWWFHVTATRCMPVPSDAVDTEG